MPSLTIHEVERLFNLTSIFPDQSIHQVQVDSRMIKPGDLYVALKGEKTDGHYYIDEVRQKGAIGAIVSKNFKMDDANFVLIRVDDPLDSLQNLARYLIKKNSPRIIGVTGSIGKTSTKHFIYSLLKDHFKVGVSPGNHNSQVGLPLTIINHTSGTEEVLVLEMGMTHSNQIKKLTEIAPPEVSIITNVELVHAENFESLKEIAMAKGEIFSHPMTKRGILSKDIFFYEKLLEIGDFPKWSFSSLSDSSDFYIYLNNEKLVINTSIENKNIELKLPSFMGNHHLHNLIAAIAVARYFNVDWESIIHTIPTLKLPERRFEIIRKKELTIINDSYNASEVSVKAAIEAMPIPKKNGRKIAVLGSMGELGKFSLQCHYNVGHFALDKVEMMYCLGYDCLPIVEHWENKGRNVFFFQKKEDLIHHLKKQLREDDVVLLKGSNHHELWKLIEEL